MNTKLTLKVGTALLALATLLAPPLTSRAQGTAFTYQGRVADNGTNYTGSAEFQATLWSVSGGGTALASNSPLQVIVSVTNGLFVLPLDFGANFPGANRWLQLEVRTVVGPFTTLMPRQPLTATPYAITAGNLTGALPAAQLSGTLPSGQLAGIYSGALTFSHAGNSFAGEGSGLTSLNASQLTGGTVPDARLAANVARTSQVWLLGGNTVTTPGTHFVGTTDNQPLEFKVNNQRALRLEPNATSPNVIGGFSGNFVGPGLYGATIGGGGSFNNSNAIFASYATIAGGRANDIGTNSYYSAIGGGYNNNIAANSTYATIAGGTSNDIGTNSNYSAMGGGNYNTITANSWDATIAGGYGNDIGTNSGYSAIGGGNDNNVAANSPYATIAGGSLNDIGTNSGYSAIGGGNDNNVAANSPYATIAGGSLNEIGTNADYSAIGGGNNNNIAVDSYYATIAGGYWNDIGTDSDASAIGGGYNNNIAADSVAATIAGGSLNDIGTNSAYSAIGGGDNNNIAANSLRATIPGGLSNTATNYAFAAGTRAKANHTGAFVWGDSTFVDIASASANSVTMRASGGYRFFSNSGATAGVSLAAGGTSWAVISDRNVKKDFGPVDGVAILEKLAALPITQWHYQWEEQSITPHIGPMAQDFKAAFYPGSDDKSITTQEADGVALAAIQGLNQKVESENAALRRELAELKALVQQLAKPGQ